MKSTEEFKKQKEEILKRAKKAGACKTEYQKAYKSETTSELLVVIKNNIGWCFRNQMLETKSLIDIFGEETLNENFIFTTGRHNVKTNKDCCIITLGSSSANVKTWDSSSANVETLGSSSANVETWDSSSANVETWDSSSANVETLGSSSANVKTWDSSSANVKTWDSSSANVKTWDSSSANVKTWGSSSANVETWDSSSANVKTWGSSSANVKTWDSSSKLKTEVRGNNSFIRNHNERTIYIKRDNFNIEYID